MTKQQSPKSKAEKVATTSAKITDDQLNCLKTCFPEAFTEGKVDMDKLKDTLGDVADNGERYSFTWTGKKDAIRLLQVSSTATLVPDKKESVDFDNTQNLFIEGDNLEVLKLLYKSYFGRVKMIYIDPPYNTGNDFIYPDDFKDPLSTYMQMTGQKDEEGNILTSNSETNGRYHSSWLSMMYPRLFLARQFLRDDGVIFVSISDHEVCNLRMMMNEIFGEENFITQLIWKSRQIVDSRAKNGVSSDHEYILVYGKTEATKLKGKPIDKSKYTNPDDDSRGLWMSNSILGLATASKRPNLHYKLTDPTTKISYDCPPDSGWRYSKETMQKKVSEKRIVFPKKEDGRPREKKFLDELNGEYTNFSSILSQEVGFTLHGTREVRELFDSNIFSFPKPVRLLKALINQGAQGDDIVLDFFAGSGSTAHAVTALNAEDGGKRKCISVQLPEPCEKDSEAYQSGFSTIADISIERIRRALKQLKSKEGFKVFKLQESHYRGWEGTDERTLEAWGQQMEAFVDPLKDKWEVEDVIYEIAIKEGYSLSIQIEQVKDVKGVTVYKVYDPEKEQTFYITLDKELGLSALKPLNLSKEDLFVCRDIALSDEISANLALQCRLKTI